MTTFSAKDVMDLRQETGLGMMDCKKALTEVGGDKAAAKEWLREKLKAKMDTRTERTTGEGRIGIAVKGDKAAIIELRTETDFTAKNEAFVAKTEEIADAVVAQPAGEAAIDAKVQKAVDDLRTTTQENVNFSRGLIMQGGTFGSYVHHDGKRGVLLQVEGNADDETLKGICQHIVFHDPKGIDASDVPADEQARIRAEAIEEAKKSGKNDEIAAKMAEGRVRKHLEESTLLNQKYIVDESKTVAQILPAGVVVKRFVRYTLGG